jgi:hypothetical protein
VPELGSVERDSELWRSAVAIACYAQTGIPGPEFAENLPDPETALTQVVTALYVPIGSNHLIEDFDDAMGELGGGTKRMAIPLDEPINVILAGGGDAARVARLDLRGHGPRRHPQGHLESELMARGGGLLGAPQGRAGEGRVVGLVFSPWHREWGRMTKVYATERRAVNALERAWLPTWRAGKCRAS